MGRRMFSTKIVDSAKFLKMPVSSQLLYFHLGVRADDDGVVEGYNVMRTVNCNEDDLKLLAAKGYIVILNEDLVTFITDWNEHNIIRADRKTDSIYKELLLNIVPEVKLIEPRKRADLKPKLDEKICPVDVQLTTNGQTEDSIREDKISKGKIIEDNIYTDDIETLWNIYPNKKGKATFIKKIPKLIKQYSIEQIKRCIERYSLEVKGKDKQYIQHGSTFFNSGYMDYLDENYKSDINIKSKEEAITVSGRKINTDF